MLFSQPSLAYIFIIKRNELIDKLILRFIMVNIRDKVIYNIIEVVYRVIIPIFTPKSKDSVIVRFRNRTVCKIIKYHYINRRVCGQGLINNIVHVLIAKTISDNKK